MFNTNSMGAIPSLSDIAAVTNANDGNGMWGSSAWWVIIIFALLFGWGNNGYGGFGNGGGTSALMSTFDTDYIAQGLRDIQSSLASNFLTLNNENLSGVCDIRGDIASNGAAITSAITNGFNTQNLQNLQNANAIQRDIYAGTVGAMQNTQLLQGTLAQMASDNRADTAQIAYNQATDTCAITTNASNNTRDIVDAVNAGNREILSAMAANKVEALQDKIADLQAQNQALTLAASQAAQNQYLTDTLRPSPSPAYVVQNPYAGCNCGYGTYGI